MSKARDIADLDFNAPDIDGGNIDGATIGASTAAAGSFTSGIFTAMKVNGSFTVNGNVDTSASLGEVLQLSQTDSVGGFLWSVDRANNTYKHMTYQASRHKFYSDASTEMMSITSSGIDVTGTITGDDGLIINGGTGNAYLSVGSNTGSWVWKNYQDSHKLALEDSDGTGEVLNFSTSGAATFSSGATFGDAISTLSNDNGISFQSSQSANNRIQIFFKDHAGAITARVGNDISGDNTAQLQFIAGTGSTPQLTIASSGAATFSSTVTSTGLNVTSNTPVLSFIESDQSNKQYQIGSYGASFAINDSSASQFRYIVDTNGNHLFNTGGLNCDFRVSSDGNTNMLFVDGGENAVGIGTNTPANYYSKNLVVSAPSEGGLTIASTATSNTNYLLFADGTSGDSAYRGQIAYSHNTDLLQLISSGTMKFKSGSSRTEALAIDASQNATFSGAITIPDKIIHAGDTNTFFSFNAADQIQLVTGGVERVAFYNSETHFNDGGTDVDFIVESNDNANMLFVDGGDNRVGIGGTPGNTLDVHGTATFRTGASTPDATVSTYGKGIEITGGNMRLNIDVSNVTNGGAYIQTRHIASAYPAAYYDLKLNPLGGFVTVNDADHGNGGLYVKGGIAFDTNDDAHRMDSYEEGTTTLQITCSSTAPTITQGLDMVGTYTLVGNVCTIHAYTGLRNITNAGAGITKITGLPFNGKGGKYPNPVLAHNTMVPACSSGYVEAGQNFFYPIQDGSAGGQGLSTGAKYLMFSLTYVTSE